MRKNKIIFFVSAAIGCVAVLLLYLFVWTNLVLPFFRMANSRATVLRVATAERLYKTGTYNDVMLRSYANDYFTLAKILCDRGKYDKAIIFYKRALQIDCWRPEKILELGRVYAKTGEYNEAYLRFKQALSLKPSLPVYFALKWELFKIKDKARNEDSAQTALPVSKGKLKAKTIYILPFGVDDIEMLNDLKVLLQDAYKIRFSVLNAVNVSFAGFDKGRGQYFLESLIPDVREKYNYLFDSPDTQAIMVVTIYDIAEKDTNFLFGRTDPKTDIGIISYNRFAGDNPSREILFKRIYTQSLSTSGFLLGMPRCSQSGCARSYSHSFGEFKRKSPKLCSECKQNRNIILNELKDYPEIDWQPLDLLRLENVKKRYNIE